MHRWSDTHLEVGVGQREGLNHGGATVTMSGAWGKDLTT